MKNKRKTRYIVAVVICVGAIGWMLKSLSTNLNYMRTVTEAVKDRGDKDAGLMRVGGVVRKGSISERSRNGAVFVLTDGPASMNVNLEATPPDLFNECAPLVVHGRWESSVFVGEQIIVQHGATYDDKKHPIGKTLVAAGCPDTTEK